MGRFERQRLKIYSSSKGTLKRNHQLCHICKFWQKKVKKNLIICSQSRKHFWELKRFVPNALSNMQLQNNLYIEHIERGKQAGRDSEFGFWIEMTALCQLLYLRSCVGLCMKFGRENKKHSGWKWPCQERDKDERVLLEWRLGKPMVILFVWKSIDFVSRQNFDRNVAAVGIYIIELTVVFFNVYYFPGLIPLHL